MAAVLATREPSAKIFTAPRRSQASSKPALMSRAEPEQVVAEPGADAQVEACHQVVIGVRAERMQHLAGRHQLDPDAQLALVPGCGVGGQLGRAVRDPAAADAGFGAAGGALP